MEAVTSVKLKACIGNNMDTILLSYNLKGNLMLSVLISKKTDQIFTFTKIYHTVFSVQIVNSLCHFSHDLIRLPTELKLLKLDC